MGGPPSEPGNWREHLWPALLSIPAGLFVGLIVGSILGIWINPWGQERFANHRDEMLRRQQQKDRARVAFVGHPRTQREAIFFVENGAESELANVQVVYGFLRLGQPPAALVLTNGPFNLMPSEPLQFPSAWFGQSNRHMVVFAKLERTSGEVLSRYVRLLPFDRIVSWMLNNDLSNLGQTEADRGDKLFVESQLRALDFDYRLPALPRANNVASPTTANRPVPLPAGNPHGR